MKHTLSGIEIEFTGMTRADAGRVTAHFLHGAVSGPGCHLDERSITAPDGRVWKIVSDSSIRAEQRVEGKLKPANEAYRVELVTPIITYANDLETLQGLVRALRNAGGITNETTGIHIHIDGADHTPRTLRNFMNIIYSRNDLLYNALEIAPRRQHYCKKLDELLVETLNERKPQTMRELENIWYAAYGSEARTAHYHSSRYAFLNLHSLFHGNGSLEIRGFNSTLHAGKLRAYWVLALAMNRQALTQKSASAKKPQTDNEKFAMRTWLNRIGLTGEEFRNCREHLCKALSGDAAWRFGRAA